MLVSKIQIYLFIDLEPMAIVIMLFDTFRLWRFVDINYRLPFTVAHLDFPIKINTAPIYSECVDYYYFSFICDHKLFSAMTYQVEYYFQLCLGVNHMKSIVDCDVNSRNETNLHAVHTFGFKCQRIEYSKHPQLHHVCHIRIFDRFVSP